MSTVSINSNISAIRSQRLLAESDARLRGVFQRLASGQRINSAADDAAGLAISSGLRSDSRVFSQGLRNVNDGMSALNIASGALDQLSTVTIRLRELATQAATGTFSRTQRLSLDTEAYALTNEFNRIIGTTSFNGRNLIDASLSTLRIQAGYGTDGGIGFGLGQELDRTVGTGRFGQNLLPFSIIINSSTDIIADFNNDGKLDIVQSGEDAGGTSNWTQIQLGNGDGSFQAETIIYSASAITSRAVGDINGDGNLDLVLSDNTNAVQVLMGTGNGSFQTAVSLNIGNTVSGVTLVDVNKDGLSDLITQTSGSSTIKVLLSNASSSFGTTVTYSSGSSTSVTLKAVDFNADGNLDLVSADSSGNLNVLFGSATGAFSSPVATAHGLGAATLSAVIDLDHDGIADAVFKSGTNVAILLGKADGTFGSRTTFLASNSSIAVGDLNGDGNLDIVSSSVAAGYVSYGNGDGTFQARLSVSNGFGQGLALADFNNDGALDIFGNFLGYTALHLATTTQTTTIARLDLTSQAGARDSLGTLDQILQRIGLEQGAIGSTQSRLQAAANTLSASRENFLAADGRISNSDIASDSAMFVREQIRQQVASAVLAQANQVPALALLLLRS